MRAKSLERHDATFLQLGAIHALRDNFRAAAETYLEALEHSPGSAELLTAAGLAYLRLGENDKALELLDASLARDPTDPRTVLAAGSLIQDKPDPDGALLSYRVAAVWAPSLRRRGAAREWTPSTVLAVARRPTRHRCGATSACASIGKSGTLLPSLVSSAPSFSTLSRG